MVSSKNTTVVVHEKVNGTFSGHEVYRGPLRYFTEQNRLDAAFVAKHLEQRGWYEFGGGAMPVYRIALDPCSSAGRVDDGTLPTPHPPANSQKSAEWDSFVEEVNRQIDYIYSEAGRGMLWVVNAYQSLLRNYVTEDWAALMDLARKVQVVYEETRDEVLSIDRRG